MGTPGKFDSRTLHRKTLNRWTGRNLNLRPSSTTSTSTQYTVHRTHYTVHPQLYYEHFDTVHSTPYTLHSTYDHSSTVHPLRSDARRDASCAVSERHIHTCVYIYIYTCICIYTHTHTCMCIYIYIHIYIYIYIHIYVYILHLQGQGEDVAARLPLEAAALLVLRKKSGVCEKNHSSGKL